jgi:hypothetical protein
MLTTLLKFTRIRIIISFVRALWFIKIRKQITTSSEHSTEEVHEHTVFSNLRRVVANKENPNSDAKYLFGIDKQQDGSKIRLLMNPVISIDSIASNLDKIKVLIIGPKLEAEILSVMSYGIPLKNITAVDLIKYSPWVDQGDMHNLPYEDNKFDLILCGWVIAYSNNKIKAAEEMTRVGKSGSIIALAATYSPLSNEEVIEKRGYLVGSEERINNTEFLLNLFKDKVKNIYFRHDVDQEKKDSYAKVLTIFSVKS